MSKKIMRAGKKSWDTRRRNLRHKKMKGAGDYASKTRYTSENTYRKILAKSLNLPIGRVFHHEGLPDLMAIMETGKIVFCEIKPKRGATKRKLLNPVQRRAIKLLLNQPFVEKVLFVRYSKNKKESPKYDNAIEITKKNIADYSVKTR